MLSFNNNPILYNAIINNNTEILNEFYKNYYKDITNDNKKYISLSHYVEDIKYIQEAVSCYDDNNNNIYLIALIYKKFDIINKLIKNKIINQSLLLQKNINNQNFIILSLKYKEINIIKILQQCNYSLYLLDEIIYGNNNFVNLCIIYNRYDVLYDLLQSDNYVPNLIHKHQLISKEKYYVYSYNSTLELLLNELFIYKKNYNDFTNIEYTFINKFDILSKLLIIFMDTYFKDYVLSIKEFTLLVKLDVIYLMYPLKFNTYLMEKNIIKKKINNDSIYTLFLNISKNHQLTYITGEFISILCNYKKNKLIQDLVYQNIILNTNFMINNEIPLFIYAIEYNDIILTRLLLEKGADIYKSKKNNKNLPLYIAYKLNNKKIFKILFDYYNTYYLKSIIYNVNSKRIGLNNYIINNTKKENTLHQFIINKYIEEYDININIGIENLLQLFYFVIIVFIIYYNYQ